MRKFVKVHGTLISIICIIFAAFILRTYQLSSVPPSISIDEMSFGYNAYSFLKTGRDEYGAFLPFTLRAYDDYRPALLSYLIMPSIQIFGLNAFGIRFPSVILSLITLASLYKTVLLLFIASAKQNKSPPKQQKEIALFAIILYAISPWNIYLSRLALDTNAGLAFFSVGLWIFLEYIVNKKLLLLLGASVFFAISFYAYNGIKIFIPFFLITLIIVFYKTLLKRKKDIALATILFIIILIPLLLSFLNTTSLIRFNSLDFFTQEQPTVLQTSSQRLLYEHNDLGKLFDNRRISIIPLFITNYLINIDPTWLYADDYVHQEYKTPDFGLFYLFELLLLIFGLYFILKENVFSKKIFFLLISWIVFSIIPAAITYDTPNAVRIYTALPAFLIIEGCGCYFLLQWSIKQKALIKNLFMLGSSIIVLISFAWFVHAYYVLLPYQYSQDFSYGASNAIAYATTHESSYKHIVISNEGDLKFSYIYYLFFTKYDPDNYIKEGGTQSGNFSANHVIGKFAFINPTLFSSYNDIITLNPHALRKNTLYIVDAGDIPQDKKLATIFFQKVHLLERIQFLNGQDAIYIFDIKK